MFAHINHPLAPEKAIPALIFVALLFMVLSARRWVSDKAAAKRLLGVALFLFYSQLGFIFLRFIPEPAANGRIGCNRQAKRQPNSRDSQLPEPYCRVGFQQKAGDL
jgi:hypothetical protein